MSQNFCMEHKNLKRERVKKSHATIKKTSTPNKISAARLDISLSEIDSATSSSSGSKKALLWKSSETNVIESQQKNERKNKRVSKNRRIHFLSQSSISTTILEQSEWETVEEETDKSLASSTPKKHDNTENIKLFEDLTRTPEMTREGIAFESLSSPIIERSRRLYLEKNTQHDNLLPIDLSLMKERDRRENEDEITLHRESNVKTYLTAREVRKKHGKLWCAILGYYEYDSKNEFVTSTPLPPPRPFTKRKELSASQNLKTKVSRQLFESDEDDPIPPGKMRIRGSLDRKTCEKKGRWARTYKYGTKRINKRKAEKESDSQSDSQSDIYSKDNVDIEFETAGPFGKKMTLAQFRHRQKMNKSSLMEENLTI
ncbi:uncharacterized protein [Linepithema humile]|uniref:uncharacterized protein n=1 Tax=Linepithema humile TaxID=83485 RepID=UPI0006233EB1|nr:PREDICTED: uncharacterized protein LOC105678314 [Linepithema humile]